MRNIQTTIQKIVIIALAVGISQSAIAENFCPNNAQKLADAWGASVDDMNKALTDDQLMFHFAQYSPENDPSITVEVAFQYCFNFERNMLSHRALEFWDQVSGKFGDDYKAIKTKLDKTIDNAEANSEEAKQIAILGLGKEEQKLALLKSYALDEAKIKAAEAKENTQADLKKAEAKVTETKDSVTAAVKQGEGDLKNLYDKCAGKGDVSSDAAAVYAAQMQAANGDENARQEMFGKQAAPVPLKKLDGNAPPAPKSDADSSGGFTLWGSLKSLGSKIADGAKAVGNSIANTWTQMSHDHPILTSFLVGAAAAAAAAAIFVSVAGVPVVGSALAAYYTITWMGTFGIASGLTYSMITAPKSVKTAPSMTQTSTASQTSAPSGQLVGVTHSAGDKCPIGSDEVATSDPWVLYYCVKCPAGSHAESTIDPNAKYQCVSGPLTIGSATSPQSAAPSAAGQTAATSVQAPSGAQSPTSTLAAKSMVGTGAVPAAVSPVAAAAGSLAQVSQSPLKAQSRYGGEESMSLDDFHLAHRQNVPDGISREYSTFVTDRKFKNSSQGTYTGLVKGYYNQAGTLKPSQISDLAAALAKYNSGAKANSNYLQSYKTIYIPASADELLNWSRGSNERVYILDP